MNSDAGEANARRAAAINWMLVFAEVTDLPPVDPAADLGAIDRAKYERRMGLLNGSLSLGRFKRDFGALEPGAIGERLLDEAYVGSMSRADAAKLDAPASGLDAEESDDPFDRFQRLLGEIGLDAGEVLVLTGSPDVGLVFSRWGASAPEVRRAPGRLDVTRFGLAVVGRGQAGHKDFEPWTQLIKGAGKHIGPAILITPSSNISGILEYLWTQRASIRRYVDAWRE
ncbi:MAG: hypothetical protein ACRDHN_20365 [Thermomicrobiales bacterium]